MPVCLGLGQKSGKEDDGGRGRGREREGKF